MKLDREATTLAEVLRDSGYATAGFVAGPYLSGVYGFLQGFDYYDDFTVARISPGSSHHEVTSPTSLQITLDWLEAWNESGRQRPFFVFLHLWDVHYDFIPPPPYDELFDPEYRGSISGRDFEMGPHVHEAMDPRDLEHLIALYDGEIRFTDDHIGMLMDELESRDLLDSTVLVVTADHGEEFFEHGRKGHRKTLYDESILVPLLIRYPRLIRPGSVVDRQVRLIDVAPTILSLIDVPIPQAFDGRSLLVDLRPDLRPVDRQSMRRDASTMPPSSDSSFAPDEGAAFSELDGRLRSIRSDHAKLIRDSVKNDEEFYDLQADPGEQRDLGSGRSEHRRRLQQTLRLYERAAAARRDHSERVNVDDELEDRLRDLGYIE
jgi:arylsulfatase A-like enzyme